MYYTLDSLEHRVKMLENLYKKKIEFEPYFRHGLQDFDKVNQEQDKLFFGLLTVGNVKVDSEGIDKELNNVLLYSTSSNKYLEVEQNSQLVCLFSHLSFKWGTNVNFSSVEPSEEHVMGLFEGFILTITNESLIS